jgi:hypothetical protein
MKYVLTIAPEALDDMQQGIDYYNGQQKGLGKRFVIAVNATLANIKKMPLAASIAYSDARYKVVGKFPYIVLYKIRGNIISISRVFNTHQQSVY